MAQSFLKDPEAVLDYKFDWAPAANGSGASNWLAPGETITDYTIASTTGLTVDSSTLSDDDTSVTVWLSRGTVGSNYNVTCHIVTSAGREDDRTIVIMCAQR